MILARGGVEDVERRPGQVDPVKQPGAMIPNRPLSDGRTDGADALQCFFDVSAWSWIGCDAHGGASNVAHDTSRGLHQVPPDHMPPLVRNPVGQCSDDNCAIAQFRGANNRRGDNDNTVNRLAV